MPIRAIPTADQLLQVIHTARHRRDAEALASALQLLDDLYLTAPAVIADEHRSMSVGDTIGHHGGRP